MSQARPGELLAELGRASRYEGQAEREEGDLRGRQRRGRIRDIRVSRVYPGRHHASSAGPRCFWLAPGPWPIVTDNDEPED
jgi:hypothetical protein